MANATLLCPPHPVLDTERRDGPTDANLQSISSVLDALDALDASMCRTEAT